MEVSRQGGTQPWEQLSSNGRVAPHPGAISIYSTSACDSQSICAGARGDWDPHSSPAESTTPCSCPGPPSPELFPADSGHSKGTTSSPWLRAGDASNRWFWFENPESLPTQFSLPLFSLACQARNVVFHHLLLLPPLYSSQTALIKSYLSVSFK